LVHAIYFPHQIQIPPSSSIKEQGTTDCEIFMKTQK
jgi:hypothetical protein